MYKIKDLHKYSKKLNVLFVEDDKSLREETQSLFKMIFKSIDTAEDGIDGLNKYNNKLYDLVITDVNMPQMDGIDMSKHIKDINPEQKIIIISAHDESNILMKLVKIGSSGFILKPIQIENLIHTLYPVCRDVFTQLTNTELINELTEKNELLQKQIDELRSLYNVVDIYFKDKQEEIDLKKEQEAIQSLQENETLLKTDTQNIMDNEIIKEYFQEDEDDGEENVLFLPDHCDDLNDIFIEIPEIVSRYSRKPDIDEIDKISINLSKASSILVYYSPYLDLLATSLSELSIAMQDNKETFIDIMNIDPQSILILFEAVSSDMERYVQRFSKESLAMKNIHHIHKPTALSIKQIITLIQPPPEDDEGIEFF